MIRQREKHEFLTADIYVDMDNDSTICRNLIRDSCFLDLLQSPSSILSTLDVELPPVCCDIDI